jgi:hypothetical protein
MEAFDETLDRRIWSLADNRIKWHTLIAERRRKVPTETERTVTALLGHHHKLDDDVLPTLSVDAEEETTREEDGKLLYLQSLFLFIDPRIRYSNETSRTNITRNFCNCHRIGPSK